MLLHFKKSNEILETWSPHCKNLAFQDPPSLNFHNRTDANVHRKIDISSEAQEVAYYIKQFDSASFRAYLVIVLKTFKIVTRYHVKHDIYCKRLLIWKFVDFQHSFGLSKIFFKTYLAINQRLRVLYLPELLKYISCNLVFHTQLNDKQQQIIP